MASRFWVGGTGTWDNSTTTHWSATSGGAGGASVPGSGDTVTFDGSSGGGTVTPNYDMTVTSITMGAFTGTLDFSANNNNPTMATFSCNGTGTRALNLGSGIWTITGNNTTVWNFTTQTNLTLNVGTSTVNFTYAGATGTRTIGGGSSVSLYKCKVSAGTDTVNFASSCSFGNDLDFTGFAGTWGNTTATPTITGSLTLGTGMTVASGSGLITLNATSAKNVTTNGVQINHPITLNGVGGSWTLKDNLDMGGASARTLTLTNGTLDAYDSGASHNVTCGAFSSSNSNTRSLDMGNGTWTLTGTGTVWNMATTTGLTFTVRTGTIKLTDASASAKTFSGGGLRYGNFWINGAGSGAYTIVGNNTFVDFKDDNSVAHTVNFTASSTQTVTTFTVSGSLGNVITLQSTSAGTAWNLIKTSGIVSSDYLSLQDSRASGGANFYAGTHSTNVSGNSGWQFSAPSTNPGNGFFALI